MYWEFQTSYRHQIFFMKDRVDKKEFTIEYCPTGEMIADHFTKPLQGHVFNTLQSIIMGWTPLSSLQHKHTSTSSSSKERVGNNMPGDEDFKKAVKIKSYAEAVIQH